MLVDVAKYKLGRRPINTLKSARLMKLEDYLDAPTLPTPPASLSYSAKVMAFPMFGNDAHSDCTAAAYAHQLQAWAASSGRSLALMLEDVMAFYSGSCGYNGTVASDQGGDEISVLNYARKTGMAGYKIDSYVAIRRVLEQLKLAMFLFGGVYVGLELPVSVQTQAVWDTVPSWDTDGVPGSWGGHAITLLDYDEANEFTGITWGRRQKMTWDFLARYCEEMYALNSPEFLDAQGVTVSGLNRTQMGADAERLAA